MRINDNSGTANAKEQEGTWQIALVGGVQIVGSFHIGCGCVVGVVLILGCVHCGHCGWLCWFAHSGRLVHLNYVES